MYGIKDFVTPIEGKYRITSGEGPRKSRRTTNGKRMSSFHHGTDWASSTPGGKPDIRNITAGEVVYTGKAGGYGNVVVVKNPEGFLVQYAHLDSIGVNVGDTVPAGGKIGVMGATGNVTGVHLDLTVTKDGKTITRAGDKLASAPAGILRRAGGSSKVTPTPAPVATASSLLEPPIEAEVQPHDEVMLGGSLDQAPMTLLQGGVGLVVPETSSQNLMFSKVADMGLGGGLESIYAEAARAIANAKDSIESKPMLQSSNPLRAELGSIFDKIEV